MTLIQSYSKRHHLYCNGDGDYFHYVLDNTSTKIYHAYSDIPQVEDIIYCFDGYIPAYEAFAHVAALELIDDLSF